MHHPCAIQPEEHASYRDDKMGKSTLFESERMMVGLNAFEPGQAHKQHTHATMDKLYHVLEGTGVCTLGDDEVPFTQGQMVVAPAGVPHGIRNDSTERLLVLAVLAPAPG